jgi:hypothetical protein
MVMREKATSAVAALCILLHSLRHLRKSQIKTWNYKPNRNSCLPKKDKSGKMPAPFLGKLEVGP